MRGPQARVEALKSYISSLQIQRIGKLLDASNTCVNSLLTSESSRVQLPEKYIDHTISYNIHTVSIWQKEPTSLALSLFLGL